MTAFQSSIDYAALGHRLRAYRLGAALRAADVAQQLGISRAAVYRMEKGEIVKIDTLERVARLLGTSLASLLGVQVEYHSQALGFLERMRQLEARAESIVAHFEPISLLLASDDYPLLLREMLLEVRPRRAGGAVLEDEVDALVRVLDQRRRQFQHRQPHVLSLIGLRGLERFLQIGMVGRTRLSAPVQARRQEAARAEVRRIAQLLESEPRNVRIGVIDDALPASTFEFFSLPEGKVVAVSPFRLGELPNVHNGIATVMTAPEALHHYEALIERLWRAAYKGAAGARHLHRLLEKAP